MIRGKKIRKPLRRLKIQEEESTLTPDFVDDGEELTLLSAINSIVTLAEDSELSTAFFEKADRFISYISERQDITNMQAVMLALFIESSAAGNKSDFSDVARYLNCNNVQVLQYKGEVDGLVQKGMLRKIKNNMKCSYDYAVSQGIIENYSKDMNNIEIRAMYLVYNDDNTESQKKAVWKTEVKSIDLSEEETQ